MSVMALNALSDFAWAALAQLAAASVHDGDLVSKRGRDELVKSGYAQRTRRDGYGFAVNELTASGRELAMRYHAGGGRRDQ